MKDLIIIKNFIAQIHGLLKFEQTWTQTSQEQYLVMKNLEFANPKALNLLDNKWMSLPILP